jgi:hypothetical protein
MLAGAAVVQQSGAAQAPADADLESARQQIRMDFERVAKVKLPMATEPAVHFKA